MRWGVLARRLGCYKETLLGSGRGCEGTPWGGVMLTSMLCVPVEVCVMSPHVCGGHTVSIQSRLCAWAGLSPFRLFSFSLSRAQTFWIRVPVRVWAFTTEEGSPAR
jgi:hypothetical protein